jgi:hypothetical protein
MIAAQHQQKVGRLAGPTGELFPRTSRFFAKVQILDPGALHRFQCFVSRRSIAFGSHIDFTLSGQR